MTRQQGPDMMVKSMKNLYRLIEFGIFDSIK
jgi:hypothetical protein